MRVLSSLLRRAAVALGLVCLAASFAVVHAAPTVKAAAPRGASSALNFSGLLGRALTALEAHDLTAATGLLTEGYRLSPLPEVLYHLGRIAVLEGRNLEARDLFRRYLADPARQTDTQASQNAEQFIAQPSPPSGSVSVLSDPGALVLVDDRVVGVLPLPLPLSLSPGAHTVALEFLDKRLESPVQVQAGRLIELRITRPSGTVLLSVLPAILYVSEPPSLPAEARRLFGEVLDQAARIEQYTLLAAERASAWSKEASGASDCLSKESCQRQLAQHNALDFLLRQRTQSEPLPTGARWKIELSLWRVDIATPAAAITVECPQCDAKQAAAKLKDAAAKLFTDGLARPFGRLRLSTEPPDAEVQLGEQTTARHAPLDDALWAASYGLTIRRLGYVTEQRTVEIKDGATNELKVQLVQASEAPKKTPPLVAAPSGGVVPTRPRWRLGVGGALIALGSGLVVAGAVALPVNGQCVDAPAVDGAACPQLYSTQVVGAVGIGLGAALIGGGIALVALPGRGRSEPASSKNTAR